MLRLQHSFDASQFSPEAKMEKGANDKWQIARIRRCLALRSRRTGQVQWNFLARRCRWYARSWVAFIFSKSGAPVGRMGQVSGAKSGEAHSRSWRGAGWLSGVDPDKRLR